MNTEKSYRGLFFAVVLLLLLPVAFVDYVPLVDLPGHLSRIHVLRNYDQVPQFQAAYVRNFALIPNLALDLVIYPLTFVMSLYQAARVFVCLSILLFAAGCWTISHSLYGRITPFAVLALFTHYNSTFFYGFVVFHLGVGLALITIGLWYRWRENWTPLRSGLLLLLSVLIYLSHLGGYLYLCISIGWLTLLIWRKQKRVTASSLLGLLPVFPPLLIYLNLARTQGKVSLVLFSPLSQKIRHAAMLLIGYDLYVDAIVGLLLVISIALAWKYGRFRFQPDIFSLGVVFSLIFAVMPYWMLSGSDADTRMVLGAGAFLLLGTTCELPAPKGKWIYSIALAALVLRIAFCGWTWIRQSDFIAGHLTLLDQVPAGARLYPVLRISENYKRNKFERVLNHIPDLATIRRQAIVPTTFAIPGQHTIVERTPRWYQLTIDPAHPETFEWDRVAREYDAIWFYGQDPLLRAVLDSRFSLIGEHGDARLYRIR